MKTFLALLVLITATAQSQGIGGSAGMGGSAGAGGSALVNQQCASPGISSGTVMTCTMPITPGSGHIILLGFISGIATTSVTSVTATNITWTSISGSIVATGRHSEIWCGVVSASAGSIITVNISTAAAGLGIQQAAAMEFPSLSSCSTTFSGANSGTSSTPTTASITPTTNTPTVFFAASRISNGPIGYGGTPTNNFSALVPAWTANAEFSYFITSTPVATSTGWTASSSNLFAASIVAVQ